jgi:hypothetical protein
MALAHGDAAAWEGDVETIAAGAIGYLLFLLLDYWVVTLIIDVNSVTPAMSRKQIKATREYRWARVFLYAIPTMILGAHLFLRPGYGGVFTVALLVISVLGFGVLTSLISMKRKSS